MDAQAAELRFETLAPPFLKFLAMVPLLVRGQEDWNELVTTLADLAPDLFEADVVSEFDHGLLPGERVKIHRVQKRAVQVEDRCFRQFKLLQRASLAYQSAQGVFFAMCRLIVFQLPLRLKPEFFSS